MENIYAAMLLHKAGKPVTEENLAKVLEAAGAKVDHNKIKALVSALESVDIEAAIKESQISTVTAVKEEKKEEKKKEEPKVDETTAAAGLGALFG